MVGRADTIPLSLFLSKAAPTLPTVISEALSSDNRFMRGMGDFVDLMNDKSSKSTVFTPAELRKADGRQLEYALFDKGVGAGRCKAKAFQVYIDGIKQTPLGIPKDADADQFEAAIFCRGVPPLAYNMTSGRGCGTLLLWTRRNVMP
jgi:hypothetical protein